MMNDNKYKGIYRIPPTRWQGWDYGADAAYFVTICTAHRERFFGHIADGDMTLTEIGQVAYDCWMQIPEHFPFVRLGAFVIMPNHVHGVIVIDKPDDASPVTVAPIRAVNGNAEDGDCNCKDAINRVSTATTAGGITGGKNPMLYDNLPRIIRWYKGRVAFESHRCKNAINRVSTEQHVPLHDELHFRSKTTAFISKFY